MAIIDNLDRAFCALIDLQNDETPHDARDRAWHKRHDRSVAYAQEAILDLRAEIFEESFDA